MALIDDYPLLKGFSKQPDGSYHPVDIKAEVEKRGMNLKQLALDAGLNQNAVISALRRPSKSGELVLADFLGVPVKYLFPTRWDSKGNRVRPRYADKYTTVAELVSWKSIYLCKKY